jgi:non-ribosomal peptide synthetase component F
MAKRKTSKKPKGAKPAGKKRAAKKARKKAVRKSPAAPRIPAAPKRSSHRRLPAAKPMRLGTSPFETGLERNPANYRPLTPLQFLERAAAVFPDRIAIIHGRQRFSYEAFYARSRRLASALAARGIRKGDVVVAMLSNTPPMLEAHYGVPMAGAVLNALNTRLDAAAIAFMLEHGGAKILLTDREFAPVVKDALAKL